MYITFMRKKTVGIYEIRNNINGHRYIGQSIQVEIRLATHLNGLRRGTHYNTYLQRAWNKYGEEAFTFTLLFSCPESMLVEQEQALLDLKPEYNTSYHATLSTKGMVMSDQQKKKISAIHKGRKHSTTQIANRTAALTGKKRSFESCQNIRHAAKKFQKSIDQVCLTTGIIMKTWPGLNEIGRSGLFQRSGVGRCLRPRLHRGKRVQQEAYAGFGWIYGQ